MPALLQSVGQNAILAVTVIPLLILYFGLIAWLTFDASQDSNWFFWLLLFLFAGPVTIPFYIWASLRARRWTSQEKLDKASEEKRKSPYKFVSEIERFRWIKDLDPEHGTMYEPRVGLSVPRGQAASFRDERAEQLLAAAEPGETWDYLSAMYFIAREQGDVQRAAGFRKYIGQVPGALERLTAWEESGADPGPEAVQPAAAKPVKRSAPF